MKIDEKVIKKAIYNVESLQCEITHLISDWDLMPGEDTLRLFNLLLLSSPVIKQIQEIGGKELNGET